ncbi:MAG: sugar kinase, partial [Pedobacter sp.]
ASFCVEKFGIEKILNLKEEEVKARVQEFVRLSSFTIEA